MEDPKKLLNQKYQNYWIKIPLENLPQVKRPISPCTEHGSLALIRASNDESACFEKFKYEEIKINI